MIGLHVHKRMKKAYLALSVIAFIIPFTNFVVLGLIIALKEEVDLGRIWSALGTIMVGGIPLLFWIIASFISIVLALTVTTRNEKLKNVFLAFPILATLLIYTAGEYHGP